MHRRGGPKQGLLESGWTAYFTQAFLLWGLQSTSLQVCMEWIPDPTLREGPLSPRAGEKENGCSSLSRQLAMASWKVSAHQHFSSQAAHLTEMSCCLLQGEVVEYVDDLLELEETG